MTKPDISAPYLPYKWEADLPSLYALQALGRGEATADQQKIALNLIINGICNSMDLPYRPGGLEGDRDTCFASGKAHVGRQIFKLINLPAAAIAAARKKTEKN